MSVVAPSEIAHRIRALARLWIWWFRRSEPQRLFALTIGAGVACGLAAVAFHESIRWAERVFIGNMLSLPGYWSIPAVVFAPALGGLLCGIILERLVPGARGSGIPEVKVAYAGEGTISLRNVLGKFTLGVVQIGSGASLGREGPTVFMCAGIASAMGRLASVSKQNVRRLRAVGAAAGIAAAFNAPLAAVTFTIEEIVGDLDHSVLSGVVIAAALAAVVERSILGTHPAFEVPAGYALEDARSLLIYALLGLVAGRVSVVFTDLLLVIRRRARTSRVPSWARPAVGGLVTGALAITAIRVLGVGGVTGGGYETLGLALSGHVALRALLGLCALKLVATSFSYSSGGVGGIFAPTLFIGGALGGAFGYLDQWLFSHGDSTLGAFALVGMGAVFAGTIRAPITSFLMVFEMTDSYGLVLPLMIADMTAFVLAKRLRPTPIYEALLEQDGVFLKHGKPLDFLEDLHVRDVVSAGAVPEGTATVTLDDDLRTAIERMLVAGIDELAVVDESGKPSGLVTRAAISARVRDR